MSDIAIRVEGLGKKYTIGHQKSGDFRNSVGEKLGSLFGRRATSEEEFWALKDVSFEIKRGEVVGIMGRNGAGKSTLLKILSRITDPSTGRFEINGRVSSLLEVGTGFHAELTGRENIYLNGTILGMKRKEIKAKFDEIVAFSGVEKFLDTPVKHYSSGMKVRLAFSVAAHLEPEILIIDEVLAVGDAEFQKKCLGKMDEVSKKEGRTVLFVSHNLGAIETLCGKGILLNRGKIESKGEIGDVIHSYIRYDFSGDTRGEWHFGDRVINKIEMYCNNSKTSSILSGSTFKVKVYFQRKDIIKDLIFGIAIKTSSGVNISAFNNRNYSQKLNDYSINSGELELEIPNFSLFRPDKYWIDFYLGDHNEDFEKVVGDVSFEIIPTDVLTTKNLLKQDRNLFFFPKVEFKYNGN